MNFSPRRNTTPLYLYLPMHTCTESVNRKCNNKLQIGSCDAMRPSESLENSSEARRLREGNLENEEVISEV